MAHWSARSKILFNYDNKSNKRIRYTLSNILHVSKLDAPKNLLIGLKNRVHVPPCFSRIPLRKRLRNTWKRKPDCFHRDQWLWPAHRYVYTTIKCSLYKFKGAMSRFVHIEKFSHDFLNSSFAIRVNLLHPSPSLFLYGLPLSLWSFSILLNCYFQVSFNLKVIL